MVSHANSTEIVWVVTSRNTLTPHLLHDSFPFPLTTSWFLSLSLFRRAVCESDCDARGEIKKNNNSMSNNKKKITPVYVCCVLPSWEESRQKRSPTVPPPTGARESRHAKTTSQPRATLSMAACMPLVSLAPLLLLLLLFNFLPTPS